MSVLDRISREPVLGFGAVGLGITAWAPAWVDNDAKKAAVAGILLWLQRTFSSSKKTAEENVATATAEVDDKVEVARYVGAVEHQAVTNAAVVLAHTRPRVPANQPAIRPP